MKRIIQEEGASALFKGNLPAEYLYLAYGAVQFWAYHSIDERLNALQWNPSLQKFTSGALSGALATFMTYPLDLIRTRFAMQGNVKVYTSTWNACQSIHQLEGIKGLYRGIWPSILSIMPQMGLVFVSHYWFKSLIRSCRLEYPNWIWSNSSTDNLYAGFFAGMFSKAVILPFDIVRKRMQVQGPDRNKYILSSQKYSGGIIQIWKQIIQYEGILAMYKGLMPAILKSGISSAVTFYIVGKMRLWFKSFE